MLIGSFTLLLYHSWRSHKKIALKDVIITKFLEHKSDQNMATTQQKTSLSAHRRYLTAKQYVCKFHFHLIKSNVTKKAFNQYLANRNITCYCMYRNYNPTIQLLIEHSTPKNKNLVRIWLSHFLNWYSFYFFTFQ